MDSFLLTEIADGVLTITMNRPARKNALTGAMYAAFSGALTAAEQDPAVRAVVDRSGHDRRPASTSQMGRFETGWL